MAKESCGGCGREIVCSWSWSKDHPGLNPRTKRYDLRCSSCGAPICVECAKGNSHDPFNQVYAHVAKFNRIEARVNRSLWENPVFVFCFACSRRIGTSDGTLVEKIVDNYEKAGRFEDLAQFYETLGMYDKAGNARSRLRQQTVKQVSVDLNTLMDKMSAGGLTVPYKCRTCGATITIDKESKSEGIVHCSYCGSAIDTESIVNLLRLALG